MNLKRLIGMITVTERGQNIEVTGISTDWFVRDITHIWETSVVGKYMFTSIGRNRFTLPSFFALELHYIISKMIDDTSIITNRRSLIQLLKLLESETWLRSIESTLSLDFNYQQLAREMNVQWFEDQTGFFKYYQKAKPSHRLKGLLLDGKAGSGKTLIGYGLSVLLDYKRTVIVCPKNVIQKSWLSDMDKGFRKTQSVWVADNDQPWDPDARWHIFHYERLEQLLAMLPKFKKDGFNIVIDESHNFTRLEAQQTQNLIEFCQTSDCQDILFMSGTPIKALGSESIPIFMCIDPFFTPSVAERFKKIWGRNAKRANDILANRMGRVKYKIERLQGLGKDPDIVSVPVKMPNGDKYTLDSIGALMQAFIAERIQYYTLHKAEFRSFYDLCVDRYEAVMKKKGATKALEDLATYKTYVAMFIRLGFDGATMSAQSKYCNEFEEKEINTVLNNEEKKQFRDVKSVVKYVDLKIRGECLGRVLGRERINCHVDMVEHLDLAKYIDNSEAKTLVFTSYVEVLRQVTVHLKQEGYSPLEIYGDTNKNFNALIELFRNDPNLNPCNATFDSLSTGVPMLMANTIFMINSPFRDYEIKQTIARVFRVGQTQPVWIWLAQLDTGNKPNISTRSRDIMEWSREQVQMIMGARHMPNMGLEAIDEIHFSKRSAWSFEDLEELELMREADYDSLRTLETVKRKLPASMGW